MEKILASLKNHKKVFLIGCGECATASKSGGETEVFKMKEDLEKAGKEICGYCVPSAPCVAAKLKNGLAVNLKSLKEAEAVLILSCGLGVQSFKENDRFNLKVLPACDTVFGAVMDAKSNFFEKCSMCGECILEQTSGICPVTLCSKGLLNGPCGGMDKGKCEVDKERDCAWILIHKELEKNNDADLLKIIRGPRDYQKSLKPQKLVLN